jgi:hypothetical protein
VLTIESWVSSDVNNGQNSFFYGFGDTDVGGSGMNYIFGSLNRAYAALTATDPGYVLEQGIFAGPGLQGRTNLHWVAVYNPPAGYVALYTNGVLAGINSGVTTPLSSTVNVLNYIGKSLYNGDPYPNLSVDEFRIYKGALHADEVALTDALGPNLVLNPSVTTAVVGNSLVASWPTNYSNVGFKLYSSTSLNPGAVWTAVGGSPTTVGTNSQQTVLTTGTAQFLRLAK